MKEYLAMLLKTNGGKMSEKRLLAMLMKKNELKVVSRDVDQKKDGYCYGKSTHRSDQTSPAARACLAGKRDHAGGARPGQRFHARPVSRLPFPPAPSPRPSGAGGPGVLCVLTRRHLRL
jgi:hypothetical protein